MTKVKVWLKAFRLRTLPLALSSIFMGSFLAASRNQFDVWIFLLCIVTTIFLQILSNVANDYGDSIHGADSIHRKGPKRAVQAGEISVTGMRTAMVIFAILSLFSGVSLLFVAFGPEWKAILFFLGIGLVCILAAITYTVGRRPYGYAGLGDFSVFIFFGLVGVLGSTYLFSKELLLHDFLPAVSCGAFAIAVLNINNIRDIESDRLAGKFSVPVRIGKTNASVYHVILLLVGFSSAVVFTILTYTSPSQLLFLLALPMLFKNGRSIFLLESSQLDPYLKQMALTSLLFVVLFGVGLLLRSWA